MAEADPMARWRTIANDWMVHDLARQQPSSPLEHALVARLAPDAMLAEDDQVRRAVFGQLLDDPPKPGVVRQAAARYVADFLVSDASTKEDARRALVWLFADVARKFAQPEDSPDEPPAEV